MTFCIRTLGLVCLAICSTQSAYSQTPPAAQYWTAYSRTASDITGDITLSSTQIVFESGVSLRLSYVGENRRINLDSFGLAGPVQIFRIKDARALTLLNGNTLCGPTTRPIPATFIGTASIGAKELGIAVFSGKGDLTGSNLESRLCGTYSYWQSEDWSVPGPGEAREETMPTVETAVQAHYGRSSQLERIEQRLKTTGVDPQRPTMRDLHVFDQLHGYGIIATEAHADRAGIRAGMHVLDLGCGLGGSSRYLAAIRECRVMAIDLTPEFIEVARILTDRCRLPVSIEYRQANALALPFEDDSFDHVWCHNVTMNIADKAGLATEVCRVLRAGGRFSCVETEQGPGGPPRFPLPWASEPAYSFLVTPETMRAGLVGAGLHVIEQIKFHPELAKRGTPPRQAQDIVMGDDFELRLANVMSGTREGRLIDQFILAEKRKMS